MSSDPTPPVYPSHVPVTNAPLAPAAPVVPLMPQTMAAPMPPPHMQEAPTLAPENVPQMRIYSHSRLFYWWPVWVVGYTMALLTYLYGEQHEFAGTSEVIHPNSNLGVLFFATLFLIVLITNVTVRGMASAMVVLLMITATVVLAYYNLWNPILMWVANLQVHLNLGAYLLFATMMFIAWFLATFVFDRMSYWRIKPGQITHEFVLGASSKSYDTQNVVLEKYRDDLFRHWLLGFGSGDMKISTSGASHEEIFVPNVLFIGSKIYSVQRLIAMKDME